MPSLFCGFLFPELIVTYILWVIYVREDNYSNIDYDDTAYMDYMDLIVRERPLNLNTHSLTSNFIEFGSPWVQWIHNKPMAWGQPDNGRFISMTCDTMRFTYTYIPRNIHTVFLCFALLWLCNRS